jgi:cysteate synthase
MTVRSTGAADLVEHERWVPLMDDVNMPAPLPAPTPGQTRLQTRLPTRLPTPRHYTIACSYCGREYDDDGLILDCSAGHEPALLRTHYADGGFHPLTDRQGIFRYQRWLPVTGSHPDCGRTVVYRSSGLAGRLHLPNLWIAFNGFWPERGATLETATFKELEACTVLGRMPGTDFILTVASSGNTGAAFAWTCSQRQLSCLIVIPEKGLRRFQFRDSLHPCVNLVVIDDGDYPDAMEIAAAVSRLPAFLPEGGVKNVGRRDGLATVLLSAFDEMKQLPAYYFQAVGSGTGAIATLEAAQRVAHSVLARAELVLPKLMLCQNLPFTPIFDAWRLGKREPSGSVEKFRHAITQVYADELTNWLPPYATRGGVYDSLTQSDGDVLVTTNAAARAAADTFLELEGIDIEPAAGVAVACLQDAVAGGRVEPDAVILLNITGGGRRRMARDHSLVPAEPKLRLSRSLGTEDAVHQVAALCGAS